MVSETELMNRYLQILQEHKLESQRNDTLSILYKTDWVRILVVPSPDTDDSATIEVEMSPPNTPSSSDSSIDEDSSSHLLLPTMIEHLKYLLSLETAGYSIDFAGNGCLLVAFQRYNSIPSVETFRLLRPPTTGS